MARKSNKTAHVLNLLAGGQPNTEQPEPQETEQEQKKKTPSNISLIDPASISDPLSSLIRDSLDKEVHQSDNSVVQEEKKETQLAPDLITDTPVEALIDDKGAEQMPTALTEPPAPPIGGEELASAAPDSTVIDNVMSDDTALNEAIGKDTATSAEAAVPSMDVPSTAGLSPEESSKQADQLAKSSISSEIEDQLTKVIEDQLHTPADEETTSIKDTVSSPEIPAINSSDNSTMASLAYPGPNTDTNVEEDILLNSKDTITPEIANEPIASSSKDEKVMTQEVEDNNIACTDGNEEEDTGYRYINMMDIIVEERLLEFMNRFNVCTCKRCIADTKALALNNLPPKYLVSPVASISPLLSFYRNKYNIYVITELTKACLVILDHPRH